MDSRVTREYMQALMAADRACLPPWQPGEPRCRCLWCSRYRCDRPLQKCAACEAEYQREMASAKEQTGENHPLWDSLL